MKLTNSPMHILSIWGKEVFIKRDDLLHPYLNGNKARKFYSLFHQPESTFNSIISYGGSQSNAMLSLAWLSHLKQWHFTYYTKSLPSHLKENPSGNLFEASKQGMELVEIPHASFDPYIETLSSQSLLDTELLVRQGGADTYAEEGLKILADELNCFVFKKQFTEVNIILSSGTGTSALYLNKYLNDHCKLYTVPCVGNPDYLLQQWQRLGNAPKKFPRILKLSKKITFAKPDKAIYGIYQELLSAGMEFDLLYDSLTWLAVKTYWAEFKELPLIFVHTGGVHGNQSQLERYRHQGIAPYKD